MHFRPCLHGDVFGQKRITSYHIVLSPQPAWRNISPVYTPNRAVAFLKRYTLTSVFRMMRLSSPSLSFTCRRYPQTDKNNCVFHQKRLRVNRAVNTFPGRLCEPDFWGLDYALYLLAKLATNPFITALLTTYLCYLIAFDQYTPIVAEMPL